jgi:hypothetical protein
VLKRSAALLYSRAYSRRSFAHVAMAFRKAFHVGMITIQKGQLAIGGMRTAPCAVLSRPRNSVQWRGPPHQDLPRFTLLYWSAVCGFPVVIYLKGSLDPRPENEWLRIHFC